MPHANDTMSSQTVNGDLTKSSASISHLTSYPVVHDSISAYKSNPLGQKTVNLAENAYHSFAAPVLNMFSGPYQYVSPYVNKADSIADSGLQKVDQTFPIVKKPTGELKDNVMSLALFPLRKTLEGKDYVFNTYSSEYQKVGGNSLMTTGKAMISTGLVVTSDSLGWLSNFLSAKKEQAKDYTGPKVDSASQFAREKADQAQQYASQKTGQAQQYASDTQNYAAQKTEQAKQTGSQKADQAKHSANQKTEQAKQKTGY
ncbi:MAG: hypothetical protein M1817_001967 [Caeruleum heppii]|nr:MAG: hypothetical protein M1817_001967 [Caeruleum heppii]